MKFRTVSSFCGVIGLEIEAEDEADARTKADEQIQEMDDEIFIEAVGLQFDGTEVEEIN